MNPTLRRALRHGGVESSQLASDNLALESPDGYAAIVASVIKSGTGREEEIHWRDRKGTARTTHVRFVPEFDEKGAVVSVLSIGRTLQRS